MKTISILGSTGSVGRSAVDVLSAHPESFRVRALTAARNVDLLADQALQLGAEIAVIADELAYDSLKERLHGSGIEVAAGRKALCEAAERPADCVLAAIMGMAGLEPLLSAIAQGACVAIANKEPLVAAGALVLERARKSGATLLPVDSEHNAVFQVFDPQRRESVESIILTASGGPFRTWSREQMACATPEQAVAHPNWSMGAKISVDSASMMNKALEIIEAARLFDVSGERISVLVNPESVVHSMVAYADGSVLAQMGARDMRTPITFCLGWPDRLETPGEKLDWKSLKSLTFEEPDHEKFPALSMAYACLREGPSACLALNAANEIAVDAFLKREIPFLRIVEIVQRILDSDLKPDPQSLEEIIKMDETIRGLARSCILDPLCA